MTCDLCSAPAVFKPGEVFTTFESNTSDFLRGGRNRIGKREKWPKKKLGGGRNRGKGRQEGENVR